MEKRIRFFPAAFSSVLFFCSLLAFSGFAQAQDPPLSPEGYWQTVPDDDGSPSVIHIWFNADQVFGKVIKIFAKPGKDPNPVCDQCEGDLKDKPVLGMTILNNLSRDSDEWSGGWILDPNNGKKYNCKIEVIESGAKLKVRGFIGFSLLGRTQYWIRVENPD